MIQTILLSLLFLFSTCVPIAKYEADEGGFEYNTGDTITITDITYDEDGEIIRLDWESTEPVCLIEVKAGTETTEPIQSTNEDHTAGTIASPNGKAISNVVWYVDGDPTAITLSKLDVSQGEEGDDISPAEAIIILAFLGFATIIISLILIFTFLDGRR